MSIVPCYQNLSHPKLINFWGRSLLFGCVLKNNSVFARQGNLQTLCYINIRLTFISVQNKLACSLCYGIQIFW